jgi:hypothetical protein
MGELGADTASQGSDADFSALMRLISLLEHVRKRSRSIIPTPQLPITLRAFFALKSPMNVAVSAGQYCTCSTYTTSVFASCQAARPKAATSDSTRTR